MCIESMTANLVCRHEKENTINFHFNCWHITSCIWGTIPPVLMSDIQSQLFLMKRHNLRWMLYPSCIWNVIKDSEIHVKIINNTIKQQIWSYTLSCLIVKLSNYYDDSFYSTTLQHCMIKQSLLDLLFSLKMLTLKSLENCLSSEIKINKCSFFNFCKHSWVPLN